jgi:hypothetical protein
VKTRIAIAAALAATSALVASCHSAPAPATPAPVARGDTTRRIDVFIGDSFSPRTGAAAIAAFVPEIAPRDSGGECMVSRTGGSGATIVTASFPNRATSHTQATMVFDSAGRLTRFSERRGGTRIPSTAGMTVEQRDSTVRAASLATRSTSISLDYAIDQAVISNRGGGKPTDAILTNVRAVEKLDKFGPIAARIERARRLCGV